MSIWWRLEGLSFATAALAYALGSIPFGLILTRMAGLGDIRAIGSGNIGATNVLRTGRRGLAAATLLLDGAKGALAVQAVALVFGAVWMPLAAISAVVGHCFPVWLRFRGGKGVATGLGVFLALDWRLGVAACATWLVMFAVTRISSAGALSAYAVAPMLAVVLLPRNWFVAPLVIGGIVFWRHRANIGRLLQGTEPRVGARK
jgi:glycerol-3-phosphate acyltransferase PlsY